MARRLLDRDPLTGLATFHDYDAASGRTILDYAQDVEPLLEANARARGDAPAALGEMVHVASIPASVQMKWLVEKGIDILDPDHRQAVAALLDDPEWRYLKVRDIILGRV